MKAAGKGLKDSTENSAEFSKKAKKTSDYLMKGGTGRLAKKVWMYNVHMYVSKSKS